VDDLGEGRRISVGVSLAHGSALPGGRVGKRATRETRHPPDRHRPVA
jgi:hypothetical protein